MGNIIKPFDLPDASYDSKGILQLKDFPVTLDKGHLNGYGELQSNGEIYYYIDQTGGNDTTGKGTLSEPFASIPRAWSVAPLFWNASICFIILGGVYTLSSDEYIRNFITLIGHYSSFYIQGDSGSLHINRSTSIADSDPACLWFYASSQKRGDSVIIFENVYFTDAHIFSSHPVKIIHNDGNNSTWAYAKLGTGAYGSLLNFSHMSMLFENLSGPDVTWSVDFTGVSTSPSYDIKSLFAICGFYHLQYYLSPPNFIIDATDPSQYTTAVSTNGHGQYDSVFRWIQEGGGGFIIRNAKVGLGINCINAAYTGSGAPYLKEVRHIGKHIRLGYSMQLENCDIGIYVQKESRIDIYGPGPSFSGCNTNWSLGSGAVITSV